MVSTEKIYQYIRENKGKGGDLYQYLRHKLKHRKQLPFLRRGLRRGRKPISLRPEIVLTNEEFEYFEVD